MSETDNRNDNLFISIVLSLQMAAVQQLGKIMSPLTGKIERDLNQARSTIDMLEMLARKTRGNLSADEEKLLNHILFELRLNYVDELKKEEPKPASEKVETETPLTDNKNKAAESSDDQSG